MIYIRRLLRFVFDSLKFAKFYMYVAKNLATISARWRVILVCNFLYAFVMHIRREDSLLGSATRVLRNLREWNASKIRIPRFFCAGLKLESHQTSNILDNEHTHRAENKGRT